MKLLRPKERLGLGYAANEAALYHKATNTLAITDALVNVPAKPPAIYDPANLRGIGDNGRNSGTLGNYILKALGAVNWQGTGSQEVEKLFKTSDEFGVGCTMSCKPTMSPERCERCLGRAENQKLQVRAS